MPHVSEDTRAKIAGLVSKLPKPRKAEGNGAHRPIRRDGEDKAKKALSRERAKYRKLLKLIAATPSLSALKRAIVTMDDEEERQTKAEKEPDPEPDEDDEEEDEQEKAGEDEEE